MSDQIGEVRVVVRIVTEVLGMKQLEVLGDQLVAIDVCTVGIAAIQAHDRVHALARLEVGKAPLLRDVVGGEHAGSNDQQQPIARSNRIADLLVKGELPCRHGDAVKPYVKPGVGQVSKEPTNKRLIVISCIGQKYGTHCAHP